MALKFNRKLENNIPTKIIIKFEKAYPGVFCCVFSRLPSASKRRFERFISQRLVHVHQLYYVNQKVGN